MMLLVTIIAAALLISFILERLVSALPANKVTRAEQFSKMNEKERRKFDILKNITFFSLTFVILCLIIITAKPFGLNIDGDDINIIDKAIDIMVIVTFFVLILLNMVTPKIENLNKSKNK